MANFEVPVEEHMVSPVHAIESRATLGAAYELLSEQKVSSLPVVEGGDLVGVLSRSDLLRIGRINAGSRGQDSLLTLPDESVDKHMTREVLTVGPQVSVAGAAEQMLKRYVHRVYVVSDNEVLGVFSTRDIMVLIRDKKANAPISESMSSPIFTIRAEEPISLATERLEKARVSGLLVLDDEWPVGVFTQREALESEALERNTPVDEVMNPAMVCLPQDTKIHRAAERALTMQARRVVAVKNRSAVGILTGLDFARFTTP